MGETSKLAMDVELPKMYRVKQLLSCEYLSEAQIVFRIREERQDKAGDEDSSNLWKQGSG